MGWEILVRPDANRDLVAACTWYERQRKGLGVEFVDEVAAIMAFLGRTPQAPRIYFRDFRCLRLRRFPYKVFYQLIGEKVVVFRVLHAKQDHPVALPKA